MKNYNYQSAMRLISMIGETFYLIDKDTKLWLAVHNLGVRDQYGQMTPTPKGWKLLNYFNLI